MPQPAEVEALSAELRRLYEAAWADLQEQQLAIATEPRQWRRRARIRELKAMVEDRMSSLDSAAEAWLSNDFAEGFAIGARSSASALGQAFAWTQPDHSAILGLAQDAFDDLLQATTGVRESTKAVIRRFARERAILGRLEGETSTQSARRLARELRQWGIHSITYADGSRHGLAEYSSTVIRTKTAVASNAGVVRTGQRFGVEFYEVFDGTQDIACASVNGTIQTAEWALANPVGHPNCQRSLGARPDLTTAEQAASAQPSTTTSQREDQSASEERRTTARARR